MRENGTRFKLSMAVAMKQQQQQQKTTNQPTNKKPKKKKTKNQDYLFNKTITNDILCIILYRDICYICLL